MFGLDQLIAGASDGTTFLVVTAVACVLGLRHASDPDHIAALATLVAGTRDRGSLLAARLGLAWGAGHALMLVSFGLPIVLFRAYLPSGVHQGAETAVGVLIVGLAVWLLLRWRRGFFHLHLHDHEPRPHVHGHSHGRGRRHPHEAREAARVRSPLQAFAIGLVHGMGGSAGVGVLLLASIHDRVVALVALALFAACTALSMALLSTGLGMTLSSAPVRRSFNRLAPALGVLSLLFGAWYSLGALSVVPYTF